MWKEQYNLSYQHMHAAPWANPHVLAIFRVLCSVLLLSLSLFHLIKNKNPTLIYFTNWGIFFTAITYTVFAIFTIRQYFFLKTKESIIRNYQNTYSPWLLWKWGIFLYCASFVFEIIITLFFWGVLFPGMKNPDIFTFVDHIAPIVILLIDYSMNRIPFSLRFLPLATILLTIYGVINMSWTLSTGHPVYPPLNFKDGMTAVWVILLGLLLVGGFFLMTWVTKAKLRKVHQIDVQRHNQFNLYEVDEEREQDKLNIHGDGQRNQYLASPPDTDI
jgi:hypothetical protein